MKRPKPIRREFPVHTAPEFKHLMALRNDQVEVIPEPEYK
jgi:hypothetical protein